MSEASQDRVGDQGAIGDNPVVSDIAIPPSVRDHAQDLLEGKSYTHYSDVPKNVVPNGTNTPDGSLSGTPVVLGVDEAGRGPVIGPMVYGIFYLPIELQHDLLATTHHFDDSKVLTPDTRARLMRSVCTEGTDLFQSCGWAIKSLSAQDISAGMLRHGGSYNLNAQAMDATIAIIRGVLEQGVNVREIYIDTIGKPEVYQKKLELVFPTISITVAKKADSLYPCVSAASVVAKVTRDVSCEVLYSAVSTTKAVEDLTEVGWGSGYPSDARCIAWMKSNMDLTFGWGSECRFSWGTVKDLLEAPQTNAVKVHWPDEDAAVGLSQYFDDGANVVRTEATDLQSWYGSSSVSIF